MKVVVTGGRGYKNQETLDHALDMIDDWLLGEMSMATGKCSTGADELARQWFNRNKNAEPVFYEAQWDLFGDNAGPLRNSHMLEDYRPDLVVAFDGGRGTEDCVKKARNMGITVFFVGNEFPI